MSKKTQWLEYEHIMNEIINVEINNMLQIFKNSNKYINEIFSNWNKDLDYNLFFKWLTKKFEDLLLNKDFVIDESYIWFVRITTISSTLQELEEKFKKNENKIEGNKYIYDVISIEILHEIYSDFIDDTKNMLIDNEFLSHIYALEKQMKPKTNSNANEEILNAYNINDNLNDLMDTIFIDDEKDEYLNESDNQIANYCLYYTVKISTVLLFRESLISKIEDQFSIKLQEEKPLSEVFYSPLSDDLGTMVEEDLYYKTLKN